MRISPCLIGGKDSCAALYYLNILNAELLTSLISWIRFLTGYS
jgi:tRNA(Ile)-lysidine synthase TilS/MesJ